jgi:hypothetical protein
MAKIKISITGTADIHTQIHAKHRREELESIWHDYKHQKTNFFKTTIYCANYDNKKVT